MRHMPINLKKKIPPFWLRQKTKLLSILVLFNMMLVPQNIPILKGSDLQKC
jgi:hypothetical protein